MQLNSRKHDTFWLLFYGLVVNYYFIFGLKVANDVLNGSPDSIDSFYWIYAAILGLITYRLIMLLHSHFSFDPVYLLGCWIISILVVLGFTNIIPIDPIQRSLNNYILLDDTQYYDDYEGNSHAYTLIQIYFPKDMQEKELNDHNIYIDEEGDYYLNIIETDEYGEIEYSESVFFNRNWSIFEGYALSEGYIPLDSFRTTVFKTTFFEKLFRISFVGFAETLIKRLPTGLIFSLMIVIIYFKKREKETNSKKPIREIVKSIKKPDGLRG